VPIDVGDQALVGDRSRRYARIGRMTVMAVVFDLDGVIVDSEVVWERVRRRFVADRGGRWPAEAQRRLMGMSTPEWAAYLSNEAQVGLAPEEVADQVIAAMQRSYAESVPLIPGAGETVRRLAARWPLAVASSSPRSLIDSVLDAAGLRDAFGAAVSSEEVARGKPAPDVFAEAAARLGVPSDQCVAIEDSSNGLRSAAAAGMAVIAVPQPHYPVDPDALALVAAHVDHVDEITIDLVASLGTPPRAR
jgi:HAD superfamily hydrolase (TIGR01509 family)